MLSMPSTGWGVQLAPADLELPRKTLSQKPNQGLGLEFSNKK